MHRLVVAGLVVLTSQTASAERATWLLDDDAAVVARIDVEPLYQLVDLAARSGDQLSRSIALVGTASRFKLGLNLLQRAGFKAAGFDERRPMWLQLGAIDGERVDRAFEHLAGASDWTPKVLRKSPKAVWRSRWIIPIRDRRKAKKTLVSLLGTVAELQPVYPKNRERLALLVGERPRKSADVVARLTRKGVATIGWAPQLDAYVTLRFGRRHAVVDIIGTFAGVPLVWARDRKKLIGAIARFGPRRSSFSLKDKARRSLTRKGVHLWVGSEAAGAALKAIGLNERLRATAARMPQSAAQRKRASKRDPDCVALEDLATRGQVSEMSLSLLPSKGQLQVRASWKLRRPDWLAAMHNPGSEVVAPGAGGSVATATVFLGGGQQLAKLRLPAPLARGLGSGLRALTRCPGGSFIAFALLRWPELAASFVADLRSVHPMGKRIVAAISNPAVAIKIPSGLAGNGVMAFDATVGKRARADIEGLFDQLFGNRQGLANGTVWGRGRFTPFRRGQRLGFGLGRRSRDWYVKLPAGKPSRSLARAWFDLPGLVVPLARTNKSLDWLGRLARTSLGKAELDVALDGDVVSATADIELQ
ncbi:MAG: hypothetical protein KJO07_00415 [Deltaproteobacteria bacterium]|nr:hypothetical protein [Deltaproteobacteria bacterium]